MKKENRKAYWENIYKNKESSEFNLYPPNLETILDHFNVLELPSTTKIIDIGGGNSYLVDHLLDLGYQNITVLDISETALSKTKERLGKRADKVTWIVSDITDFDPRETYDFWHDRAAFHFLSDAEDITTYLAIAERSISDKGHMLIDVFSEDGPEKYKGIPIKKYSEQTLTDTFAAYFTKKECVLTNPKTPSKNLRNLILCSFKKAT